MLKDKVLEYWESDHFDELTKHIENGNADFLTLSQLYTDSFKENPKEIYKDIEEIAGALEQSDFIEYCEGNTKNRLEMIEGIKEAPENSFYFMFPETESTDPAEQETKGGPRLEELKNILPENTHIAERRNILINDLTRELTRYEQNYENCFHFFDLCLSPQLSVIDKYLGGDRSEYTRILDSYITRWYEKPEPLNNAHAEGSLPAGARAQVNVKHADFIEYPVDKPNSYIWNLLEENTGGQLKFNYEIDMFPKRSDIQTTAIYSINFEELGDNLKISKKLTPFDKRVYIGLSALFNAGNDVVTLTQIYYSMGYTGKPSEKQITRINDAVEKMRKSYITFDNESEAQSIPKYSHFKYNGYLLPIESITATINGKLTESAIKMFREPPLMTFAKQRDQFTTITIELLQSPVNKTDANLAIDDYLLERISREDKKGVKTCRLLYETIYKRANITTRLQRSRAPEKIRKYLNYYKQQGFIKDYSEQPDGVTIEL